MTNQSIVGSKRKFSVILSTVIALVLVIIVSASTVLANNSNQYDVSIIDNGEKVTITTVETEPIKILNNAGISLTNNDKIDISSFVAGEGGIINISRLNSINIDFDGNILTYNVYSSTVGNALIDLGINLSTITKLNYDYIEKIVDGMVITLDSEDYVTLSMDGKDSKYPVVTGTVGDLLSSAGIALGDDDYTEPEQTTALEAGLQIDVCTVEYKQVTETETLPYSTTKKENSSKYEGVSTVITKGENGSKKVTYQVKYVNGEEIEKVAVAQEIVKEAVDEVVEVGTKQTSGTTNVTPNDRTSYNGIKLGQVISGKSTRYCSCAKCCGTSTGITASGKVARNGMSNPYYVALNWLPLGSVININGTNYTVVDRGGSSLSRVGRVDIFTPQGHQACFKLSSGSCTITIVRIGW